MKSLVLAMLPVFSILGVISPVSCDTSSSSVETTFLQCLSNHSQFSNSISAVVYTSDNANFSYVLSSYVRNLRFSTPTTPKPLLIVAAKHYSHVQATVVCAKSVGLEIRIRSGGHDYEGLSYVSRKPFIVLDMFNLRSINIDLADENAWIQSGATLGELYYAISAKSKVHGFPAGVCLTLGAGGHFTGGGYGNMMRKYGLSIDNIVDAQIVNVKGEILDRKSMGEDLFWAIRGGGAASFGVILVWKVKLVKVPEKVTVFQVERTLEQGATDIVVQWERIADKIDNDLFIRLMLAPGNGSRKGEKTITATFISLFLGDSGKLLRLLNKSLPQLGLQQKDCVQMSWIESILFWAGYPNGTSLDVLLSRVPKGLTYLKRKSDYVQEPISKKDLEALWKVMIEIGDGGMLWNPYGGKMSEISDGETPFPHRKGNIFKIQYSFNWKDGRIETTNRYLNLTRKLYEAMTPHVSKNPREAFLNYRDIDIGTNTRDEYKEGEVYGFKYFKHNFDRLVQIKTKVDPDNFFRNEQSIPTHTPREL
ncbi:berberine bridge enzyme-like 14 [Argentina anserina]|uniref:berberine bridge enzyme-like 14 n=1 Tax=Argentina anserina TaxID=57926 RepID=UPI0021767D41|nr:berberine bridge enzyme-like 14 [Potentilla anserina]